MDVGERPSGRASPGSAELGEPAAPQGAPADPRDAEFGAIGLQAWRSAVQASAAALSEAAEEFTAVVVPGWHVGGAPSFESLRLIAPRRIAGIGE